MRKLPLIGSLFVHGVVLLSLTSIQPVEDLSYGPQQKISLRIQQKTAKPEAVVEEITTNTKPPEATPPVAKKVVPKKTPKKAPVKKLQRKAAVSPTVVTKKTDRIVDHKTRSSTAVKTPAYVSRSDYIRNPLPEYPLQSRRKGHEGTVLLLVILTDDGYAHSVSVYKSSGHAALDKVARKTVKSWQFTPPAGRQTASLLVPIRFKLS